MFSSTTQRGFTLIELLVVIAIIGLLSSVVLASLNTARGKGANAAVKSNLNNIRAQAELRYDIDTGVYSNVCADAQVVKGLAAANTAGGSSGSATCGNSAAAWAAWAPLKVAEGTFTRWCVDSTGTAKGEPASATLTNGTTTVCP